MSNAFITQGGNQVHDVLPPTLGTDVANKDYVDGLVFGDPAWATAPFWAVSWSTGSDSAVGWGVNQAAADLVPVKSIGEVFRRLPKVTIAETVIHLLDSQPESELTAGRAIWNGMQLRNVDARVRILGRKTAVAIGGGFTGVITGYTAAAPGTNGEAQVTIATLPGTWSNSGPGATSLIGKMIQKNDGTKTSFVLHDAGGKTCRIGWPDSANPAGSTVSAMIGSKADFVNGETVIIYDLPELPAYPFGSAPGDYQDNLVLGDIRLRRAAEGANVVLDASAPNLIHCRLTDPVIKGGLPTTKLIGCLIDAGAVTVGFWAGAGGVQLWYLRMLGTCILMNNSSMQLVSSCDVEGGDGTFAAFAMQDGSNLIQTGACALGAFRLTTPVIIGNKGSTLTNLGSVSPIYGAGNSTYILNQDVGAKWKVYRTGLTATTSLAHPLRFGDTDRDYGDMDPHLVDLSNGTELLDTV
jgi:hypothetical protein